MQVFANVIFAAALILPSGEPDDWSREFRGLISDYPEDLEAVYAMPDRVKARVDRALLQLSHGAGPRAVADVITGENFIARAVVGKRLIEAGSAPDSVIARLFRDKKRVVRYATMRAYQATADFNAELLEPLISDSDQAISELAALAILERQKERVVELLPKLVRRTRAFQHIYDSIEPMERLKVRAKVRELRKSINPEVREAAIARCGTEGWYEPSEIRKFMSSLSPQDRHFGCGLVRTAEQANALEDVLASCLREETSVGHAAISAASWSSRYLPKLRKLMDWEDLLSQLCAAESIAIVDPSDKASVERLATLALSKEPDVAVSAL
ncbi:MAG: hypothetical protein AB8G99_22480 [Planctomycetaceae bacterium]